ncbi:winged helix-turn-helix transcriptional regulator [Sneathia sanguinegens]|uniref:Winged helix-turn-helix transcriptional regulator n=1 Tax=Sneathia sanguinegens TaxID=40543 RepID=A0ABT7HJ04_9FUSO|nr:carbohydrate kinase [Sneathia sanguinegens]MDK9580032.1 winged helix-turn-helix transcriptional regulator [Sneathia sanguinegens]
MTKRERQIYELIKSKPSITQNQIAKELKISRASVAVHITHIIQKGFILGRQYLIKSDPSILVIGACNLDLQGIPNDNLKFHDSNIGKINVGLGGVGRNIAVNLKKLMSNINFITVLGENFYSNKILDDLNIKRINTSDILRVPDDSISMYLSILDENGEMLAGVSDMNILRYLTPEFLKTKEELIKNSEIIVIDTNIPKESIEYIANLKHGKQKLIVDTVSIKKAAKISNILDKIDVLKTNKLEIEALFDRTFRNKKEIRQAMRELIAKGVKNIYLTLGHEGVLAMNSKKSLKLPLPLIKNVVDVTGAGDIFTATLVFCTKNELSLSKTAKVSQAASTIKIAQHGTVPENFSFDILNEQVKKLYNETIFVGDEQDEF